MKNKNRPKGQHYIPRTYLKQFQIQGTKGSFTYCYDLSNKYKNYIQKVGLNEDIFKIDKYYNYPIFKDAYALETAFSEIENDYNHIIEVISSEKVIDKKTVGQLMVWIFISKMRSPYIRNNIENKLLFQNSSKEHINIIKEAKIEHLSIFANFDKFSSNIFPFVTGINVMNWKIFVAPDNYSFIGCDNPGFSISLNPEERKDSLYKQLIEVEGDSIIYYVLSKKYCVELSPFKEGVSLDRCAMNMDIEFERASVWLLDIINKGTYYTAVDILFCDDKEQLKFVEDFSHE